MDGIILSLIDQLDGDHEERTAAQRQLAGLGAEAVGPLIEVVRSEQGRPAWAAAEILGAIGDRRAVEPLLESLPSENALLGSAAAKALAGFGDEDILLKVGQALPNCNIITQQTIVMALQHGRSPRVVKLLVDELQRAAWPTIRCAIIQSLITIGDPAAVPAIRPYVDDPDHHVRDWAATALRTLDGGNT